MTAVGRTLFAFAWLTVPVVTHSLVGTVGLEQSPMDPNPDGCPSCHVLADVLPEGHSREGVETIESCVNYHSTQSPPVAWGRIVHWKHYTLEVFPGDCWSCHGSDEASLFGLLGTNRGSDAEVSRDKVERMESYFKSWAGSAYLDCSHGEHGTDCSDCHSGYFPEGPASMTACMECHGSYSGLSVTTGDADPNPHASHLGEIDCGLCHKSHEDSVLVCNQCHNYNLVVP
jgi:hypothetical protein